MPFLKLIPATWLPWLVGCALVGLAIFFFQFGGSYEARRYGEEKAQLIKDHDDAEAARMGVVLADLRSAQEKSRALSERVQANDDLHQKELSSVQQNQKVLASNLATAHLRLSVILAAGVGRSASGEQLPTASGACSVVHGGERAELDPAHAQRIVSITGDGDEGLTALAACQGYIREIRNAGQPSASLSDTGR